MTIAGIYTYRPIRVYVGLNTRYARNPPVHVYEYRTVPRVHKMRYFALYINSLAMIV